MNKIPTHELVDELIGRLQNSNAIDFLGEEQIRVLIELLINGEPNDE